MRLTGPGPFTRSDLTNPTVCAHQASGITVPDEIINAFNLFKLNKTNYQYITYKIDGDEFVVDMQVEKEDGKTFEDFTGTLPENEPRFIVYDYHYETTDGRPADKVVLITWCPDTAPVRQKMKAASTKDAVKSAFGGISVDVQATDFSELTDEALIAKCNAI